MQLSQDCYNPLLFTNFYLLPLLGDNPFGLSLYPKYAKEGLKRECQRSDKHETSCRQQGDKPFYSSKSTKMFVWNNRILYNGSSILRGIHCNSKKEMSLKTAQEEGTSL
jgi:hypothetical protein